MARFGASVLLALLLPIPALATDGPAAHWPLRDGDAGQGQLVGPEWVAGGLRFDGQNDRVELGTLDLAADTVTLCAWVLAESFPGGNRDPRILSKAKGGQEQDHWFMLSGILQGGAVRLRFRLKSGGTTATLVAGDFPQGQWVHVAATYDGQAMRLYRDGQAVGSMPKTGAIDRDPTIPVWLGDNPPEAGSRPWDGLLEEVRIYDRALTESELAALVARSPHAAPPAVSPAAGRLRWRHLSTATGDLPPSGQGNQQTTAVVGDFDGDGLNDFVIAERTRTPSVVWYRRTATGWTVQPIDDSPLRIEAGGTAGDLDGDGDLDLVMGGDSSTHQVWWWENPGPAYDPAKPWPRHLLKDSGARQSHDQMLGDFDGDGKLELAFWNQLGRALLLADVPADPRGGPWPSTQLWSWPDAFKYEGMARGDVDGEGVDDLVCGGLWLGWRDGMAQRHVVDDGYGSSRSAVGDLIEGGWSEVVLNSGDGIGPLNLYQYRDQTWVKRTLIERVDHGHTLEVADVDGDGHLDIHAAEMDSPGAGAACRQWLLYGDGQGGFETQLISTGVGNHMGRVADLDGDGDLDLLGKPYTRGAPRIDVWLNEGPAVTPGAWRRDLIDGALPANAVFILAGDIDGDERTDLVGGGWWWRNPGALDGGWKRRVIGAPLENVALVADLDDDGDLDLFGTRGVGASANHELAWARNDGRGEFTVLTNIETGGTGDFLQGVALGDFGRGRQIALSWHNGGGGIQAVTVPRRPSESTWPFTWLSETTLKEALAAGDIDRDGDLDLLLGTTWLRNDGEGAWTPFKIGRFDDLEAGAEHDRCALADLNGDGRLDAVQGLENGTWLLWFEAPDDPTRAWTRHTIGRAAGGGFSLDCGDLDGDGDVDVVLGEHRGLEVNRLLWYENDGTGETWAEHELDRGGTAEIDHHDGTQLFDLDGDGRPEIVSVGWYNKKVWIFRSAPRPTFRYGQVAAVSPPSPWAKCLADLDGDGQLDGVVGGNTSQLTWYRWPDWRPTVIGSGYNATDAEAGDLDRDGDLDLVVGNTWFENPRPAGDPGQGPWPKHPFGDYLSHDVSVADLDGDGDLDVVDRNQGESGKLIRIWRQDEPGHWTERQLEATPGEGLGLGDLDGDGDLDILLDTRWFENPGTIVGSPWPLRQVSRRWTHSAARVECGDINGDGRRDLVVTPSEGSYRLSWFEAPADPLATDWREHIVQSPITFTHGLQLGDVDLDGRLDIVTAEMHQSEGPDEVMVFLNRDDGRRWEKLVIATTGSHQLQLGDLGGDGDLDLFGVNWSGPFTSIEVWENLLR